MWFFIHLINTIGLIIIIVSAYNDFLGNPLVTKLHDTLYPIAKIPFPAVAICNNNRISRNAANKFAKEL